MDEVIKQSIEKIQLQIKNDVPWKPDEPFTQSFYTCNAEIWSRTTTQLLSSSQRFSTVALYSWNIDFMLPFPQSRMRKALQCLRELIDRQPNTISTIIFLQECTAPDLQLLAEHEWIRQTFQLSDLDTANWSSGYYGTITLVDRRLTIAQAFRVHYAQTQMERDAFFTDIGIGRDGNRILRVCNSHLESLALEPPKRPHQVALASRYMHEGKVAGALFAGDFNAIQDFDRTLHSDHDLRDAYLEQGGNEDNEAGYTWGQQASTRLRQQFGLSRMDKIFYCGQLQLKEFARFGADVEVEDNSEREHIIGLGFGKAWITDHLGVRAVFDVAETDLQKL